MFEAIKYIEKREENRSIINIVSGRSPEYFSDNKNFAGA